jgi:hypothetical protein
MTLYMKWLDKHYQSLVPTYIGLLTTIVFSIALGGLSIGYTKILQGSSFGSGVVWVLIGACITLLTQAFSIKVSDKIH